MSEDLTGLDSAELESRVARLRERMRPLQQQLDALRAERDVLLTELRRRERQASMRARADVKGQMRAGALPSLAELVANATDGELADYVYNLKTGGEVMLGFPGARRPTLAFTDGRQVAQADDFRAAARYYEAGWELGSPGRPGVRVHFPGSRQERLVDPADVFARPRPG